MPGTELEKIGVSVRRTLPDVTPQVFTPTMPMAVVGPCFQIVDLYSEDGTINPDASVSVPAVLIGNSPIGSASQLASTTLDMKVDKTTYNVVFPTNLQTKDYLLSWLTQQVPTAKFSWGPNGELIIRTLSVGDAAYLEILSGSAVTLLGFAVGQSASGSGAYQNEGVIIPFETLPNPGDRTRSFSGLESSIRVFLKYSGTIKEVRSDEALLAYTRFAEVVQDGENLGFFPWENLGNWVYDPTSGLFTANYYGQPISKASYRKLYPASGLKNSLTSGERAKISYKLFDAPYAYMMDGASDTFFVLAQKDASVVTPTEVVNTKVTFVDSGAADTSVVFSLDETNKLLTVTHGSNATVNNFVSAVGSSTAPFYGGTVGSVLKAATITGDSTALTTFDGPTYVFQSGTTDTSVTEVSFEAADSVFGAIGNFRVLEVKNTGANWLATSIGGGTNPADLKTWTIQSEQPTNAKTEFVNGSDKLTFELVQSGVVQGYFDGTNGVKVQITVTTGAAAGTGSWTVDSVTYDADGKLQQINIAYNTESAGSPSYTTVKQDFDTTASSLVKAIISVAGSGTSTLPTDPNTGAVLPIDIDPTVSTVSDVTFGAWVNNQTDFATEFSFPAVDTTTAAKPLTYVEGLKATGGKNPINFKASGASNFADIAFGKVVGEVDLTTLTLPDDLRNSVLRLKIRGVEAEITFDDTITSPIDIVTAINNAFQPYFNGTVAQLVDNRYLMTFAKEGGELGLDSTVELVQSVAVAKLFGSDEYIGIYEGYPLDVSVGDSLYIKGTFAGSVTNILPLNIGGLTFDNAVLVIDRDISLRVPSTGESAWYIRTANVNTATSYSNTRPTAELVVDSNVQTVKIKPYLIRSSVDGTLSLASYGLLYAVFKALRLDSDLLAGKLLESETALNDLKPFTIDNPLGVAAYLTYLAEGGISRHYVVGIDEISLPESQGTADAYVRAFSVLSSLDIYSVVPLTDSEVVHRLAKEHAELMSDEKHKSERIAIVAPKLPTRYPSTTHGQGTATKDNDSTVTFDIQSLNVQLVMSELGIPPADQSNPEVFAANEIYLDITSSNKHWLIYSVSGQSVTVHIDDSWWQTHEGNADGFYATEPLPAMQADGETCYIRKRGAVVSSATQQAEAMREHASSFDSINVRVVGPDKIVVPLDGQQTTLPGYYLAVLAGSQIAKRLPSLPLTGEEIPLVIRVIYPSGMSEYERSVAAAGGYSLAISKGAGTVWRDFLTTKTDAVENFEHSVVTPDHFAAKMFRNQLLVYVGPHMIDADYMNIVETVARTVASRLVELNVYKECDVQSLAVAEDDPRQLILSIDRTTYYPARGILVVLV